MAEKHPLKTRILTMCLDKTVDPPRALVHIVDDSGGRRGTLDEAMQFIEGIRREVGAGSRNG